MHDLSPRTARGYWQWLHALLLCASLLGCLSPQISKATSARVGDVRSALAVPQTPAEGTAPLCRLGINVSSFVTNDFFIDDFDIAPLRAGWYIDYRAKPSPPANNGAEYAMVVGVFDNEQGGYGYGPTGTARTECERRLREGSQSIDVDSLWISLSCCL